MHTACTRNCFFAAAYRHCNHEHGACLCVPCSEVAWHYLISLRGFLASRCAGCQQHFANVLRRPQHTGTAEVYNTQLAEQHETAKILETIAS